MSVGDARKRNNRCRNRACACTGECFIDDGTGDFASKPKKRGIFYSRSPMDLEEFCQLYSVTPQERNMLIDYLKLIRNRQLDKYKANNPKEQSADD